MNFNNVQISNVPIEPNENLQNMICEIGQKVVVPIDFKVDIQAIYRVPSQSSGNKPIIVKFINSQLRTSFLIQCKKKKVTCNQLSNVKNQSNNQIYVEVHLTPSNKKLFYEARQCVKDKQAKSVYTIEGKIFLRADDMSRPVQVTDLEALQTFLA